MEKAGCFSHSKWLIGVNQMFTRGLSQAAHAMINIIMNAELAWAN